MVVVHARMAVLRQYVVVTQKGQEGSDSPRVIGGINAIAVPRMIATLCLSACGASERSLHMALAPSAWDRPAKAGRSLTTAERPGAFALAEDMAKRKNGSLSVLNRFWSKVAFASDNDCWLWTKSRDRYGYGRFTLDHKIPFTASRLAWILTNAEDAEVGLEIMHSCDNPPCCNPSHLSKGTRSENYLDACRKGRMVLFAVGNLNQFKKKTHCHRGHALTADNLVRHRAESVYYARGWRRCRACHNEDSARDHRRYRRNAK